MQHANNDTFETIVLGIESSCDDTGAAVVGLRSNGTGALLSNVVHGQNSLHAEFGGVVPEVAARAHAEKLDTTVEDALAIANIKISDLDAVAATAGPGLIGGLLSGVMTGKAIAYAASKPFLGINHLAGHALTPRLTDNVEFPYLMLLVSGGHCQFLIAKSATDFQRLGGTIDDAPGEAFDKVARLLGLEQPGGPAIERIAQLGDPNRFQLPRPLLDRPGCDMSFSGLKTAVLRERDLLVKVQNGLRERDRSDIAAAFQRAVCDVLVEKSARALSELRTLTDGPMTFAVAGGVAANSEVRAALNDLCERENSRFVAPPLALCTDNAAMIAWAGIERFQLGLADTFDLAARPRWPLDATQPALLGSGKKGAKA